MRGTAKAEHLHRSGVRVRDLSLGFGVWGLVFEKDAWIERKRMKCKDDCGRTLHAAAGPPTNTPTEAAGERLGQGR